MIRKLLNLMVAKDFREVQKEYIKKHPEHKWFIPGMLPIAAVGLLAGGAIFFVAIKFRLKPPLFFPLLLLWVLVFSTLAEKKLKSMM